VDNKPIHVIRSSLPDLEEFVEEIRPIWDTHILTNMGSLHQKLENELRSFLRAEHIMLFVNGHLALELALQALRLHGEVITTPFTFASTTHAIVRNHLTPVFCDIDPVDYTIDTSKIESLITDRTCAILPVHVYGNLCNVEQIERIAKQHDLKVIYDAAHAFGETYEGRDVSSFGDVSMFSFHATKVFHCIEGGAVVYSDAGLERALYSLKNFGIQSEEVVTGVGSNAKMNEFQAAMGLCNLRHLSAEIEKRKRVFERYTANLHDVEGLAIKREHPDVKSNYMYFPIVINEAFGLERNEVSNRLKEHGIYPRKYFYPLISDFDCYRDRFNSEETPVAKRVAERVLTLPMYADLAASDVDRICDLLREMKGGKGCG